MISVIVPYKDGGKWLGRCIDSLVSQDGDFEFILVNDGSKDDGPEIVARYEDSRIIRVDNQHKPGVSGARNTGLDIASGEWITFLDADDKLNTGADKMFRAAIKSNRSSIYQFNHYRHYAKINKTALKYTNKQGSYSLKRLPRLWYVVWNKIYDAELVKGLRFDEGMQFGEDELYSLECLARYGHIECIDAVTTTHYFENDNSLSKVRADKELFKHAQTLTAFIKKHKEPEIRRVACMRLSEHWSYLFLNELTKE